MKFSKLITLFTISLMLISCADNASTSAATPLPSNETMTQYMNPSGYAYQVVDRVCDHSP